MTGILLTKSTTFIIGPVAAILGYLMDGIYNVLDMLFNVQNVGISIIIFTIIIYTLMIPLNYKQQKSQRLSSVMQPEIQAIQKKYKDKKDQVSMQRMQEETKMVYDKYGTSAAGGCVQLLIQMPILFGLYQVIRNIPAYVTSIYEAYQPLAEEIMTQDGYQTVMETIGEASPIYIDPDKYDYTQVDTIVDVLYKFQTETWTTLTDTFSSLGSTAASTQASIEEFNTFLGINISNSPLSTIQDNYKTNLLLAFIALMIPLLAGLSQYISIKLTQSDQKIDPENPMASSMNTMTTTMPLLSVFMCFTFASGLGIYWIASAVVRTVQQVIMKKYLARQSLDEIIEKNKEKAAAKREKRGISAAKLNEMAQTNTRKVDNKGASQVSSKEKEEMLEKSNQNRSNAKPGSLSARANMVKDYNEGNKK